MESIQHIINFLADPKYLIVMAAALLLISLKYPQKFYSNITGIGVFAAMMSPATPSGCRTTSAALFGTALVVVWP